MSEEEMVNYYQFLLLTPPKKDLDFKRNLENLPKRSSKDTWKNIDKQMEMSNECIINIINYLNEHII